MTAESDPLARFVEAQEHGYAQALGELLSGRKRTHWIWYVLPQLRELGRSPMARGYGISGRGEASKYVAHPVLGPRLIQTVETILNHSQTDVVDILGEIDALKFRSCLTLFAEVAPHQPVFSRALEVFFEGKADEQTLRLLSARGHEA